MGCKSSSCQTAEKQPVSPMLATIRKAQEEHYMKVITSIKEVDTQSAITKDPYSISTSDLHLYEYPFENIVLEGGGSRGLAYIGCVEFLEEINVWPQIKRFAGVSAGAIIAALCAVGYNSGDLQKCGDFSFADVLYDARCGSCSICCNVCSSYGWNPGKRFHNLMGEIISEKTNDPDFTFKQLYNKFGKELCIVVTNISSKTELFCHVKTTPDMPIRLAVRMSMSIPGLFFPIKNDIHGASDYFVDGGVLCNYPVHCYDGWWLSMKPEDNFLEKLQPLEELPRLMDRSDRFGVRNDKTLGFVVFSDGEEDLMLFELEQTMKDVNLHYRPDTKLARERSQTIKLKSNTDQLHKDLLKAVNNFLKSLKKNNEVMEKFISRSELEAALNDETDFPKSDKLLLFGNVDNDAIAEFLDTNKDGMIDHDEMMTFFQQTGINLQARFVGYQSRAISSLKSYMSAVMNSMWLHGQRVFVNRSDFTRTVGVNTGHIGTADFTLEPADKEFAKERGKRCTEAFFKNYVEKNNLKKKSVDSPTYKSEMSMAEIYE